jgi:hypothetical protein
MDSRYRAAAIACFGLAGISLLVTGMHTQVEHMITPPPSVTIPWEVKIEDPWAHIGCCCTPVFVVLGLHLLVIAPDVRIRKT